MHSQKKFFKNQNLPVVLSQMVSLFYWFLEFFPNCHRRRFLPDRIRPSHKTRCGISHRPGLRNPPCLSRRAAPVSKTACPVLHCGAFATRTRTSWLPTWLPTRKPSLRHAHSDKLSFGKRPPQGRLSFRNSDQAVPGETGDVADASASEKKPEQAIQLAPAWKGRLKSIFSFQ